MKAHVVENGIVVNVINVEPNTDLTPFNAVKLSQFTAIGDTVVDGESVEGAEREDQYKRSEKRELRNKLLAETDCWALSDTPDMTQEQIDYRQALRDLPAQEGFPDVAFPTKP